MQYSIESLRQSFLDYLKQESFQTEPKKLYEPNNYFLQIGGKRLRPIVLLLINQLFDGKLEDALPIALSVEYFHNFTLIHDDIMDSAPVRRGFATMHQKYNLNTAILSGDVLLVKAYEYLAKTNLIYFGKLFAIFSKTAVEVCEGQQYDIDFETQDTVTHDEYIKMIRLKTSVLLAASMKMGAITANVTDEVADLIYDFALNLGIAFQIQDDILDAFGDEEIVGKQPCGDIIQNKKTLLLIEALEKCEQDKNPILLECIADKTLKNEEKIDAVLKIFNQYKIKAFGIHKRDAYIEKSLESLAKLELNDTKKTILQNLINHLVVRDF